MKIGEVLRAWRHHNEMTLEEAARAIKIPVATLDRVERGDGQVGRTLVALFRFLFEE
jgi:cytoskeletal protein RodZ